MIQSFDAMQLARVVHAGDVRKGGAPYVGHLAEVAGLAAPCARAYSLDVHVEQFLAVCWLHDAREDHGDVVTDQLLRSQFGPVVADGVAWLSDLERGNRAERMAASRERLSRAPSWIQTIKAADVISNTTTILQLDPHFAPVFLDERAALMAVLGRADGRLLRMAHDQLAVAGTFAGAAPAGAGGLASGAPSASGFFSRRV